MQSQEHNESVKNASADGVDEGKFGQAGLLDPVKQQRSPSGQGGPSVSQLRGSRASIAAPTKERVFNPHATNPGRIPTAGGVAVGSKQYEQRRASRVSSDMGVGSKSPPQSPPPVEEEAEGSKETGGANGAFSSPFSSAPAQSGPAFPVHEDPDSVAPDAPAPSSNTGGGVDVTANAAPASTTEKAKETVKENLPSALGGTSSTSNTGGTSSASPGGLTSSTSPTSPSKERRGSRFDAFKSKLGMGSNK